MPSLSKAKYLKVNLLLISDRRKLCLVLALAIDCKSPDMGQALHDIQSAQPL